MALSDNNTSGATAAAMESESNSCSVRLSEGLRSLYSSSELCDMTFVCQNQRFPAHKAMLAAMSENFRTAVRQTSDNKTTSLMEGLLKIVTSSEGAAKTPTEGEAAAATATPAETGSPKPSAAATEATQAASETAPAGSPATETKAESKPEEAKVAKTPSSLEFQVEGIATAEAIQILLSYMYGAGTGGSWTYEPSSSEVNKDVLRLASEKKFGLNHLHEHAARWLAKGLTTGNVVERLVTCDEFGLDALRAKMIDQLTANPAELMVVSSSPEIMKYPQILQDLLCQFARVAARPAPAAGQEESSKDSKPAEKAKEEKKEEEKPVEEEQKEEEVAPKKRALEKVNSNSRVSNKAGKAAQEKPAAKRAKRAAAGA
mmetsp:Transcript_30511/g.65705  ORF Transcript_30511/g.65705 Transcript_30511/m.65705 type:complete len:374 (-) Transcript_30511:78-1199(-)|eukprot:CAMPEP_0206496556 /NCGR_PEP_ID=MMETSP0324_2-20121206/49504_1 /ASSEMBLY_ACC=CAM_ASM_000836 /TAXON_ID=2866 /ORGANISM="Crypthecodinium cohnii, Strain Seligo" /LENGTH=373 /DNA_ID=CAMNT_0053981645 /DNA_START=46 /DNA_END=1167 /DNA_ORIENTATION=-